MTTLIFICCVVACVTVIGRNVAASVPEPVFLGSDGFGC
jgi:hypothetical protein